MQHSQLRIGLTVQANQEFSGVPTGTTGKIVERSNSWPDVESVAVQWQRQPGDTLVDWFSFNELQYLDVPEQAEPIHEIIGGLPVHVHEKESRFCTICGINTRTGK